MIEVKNLHKGFGDVKVLKGITTTFHPGKTSLIIGQSGSENGKIPVFPRHRSSERISPISTR